MKNMIKKNQMMITALAIMIAVAGYLNFAGTKVTDEEIMSVNGTVTVDDKGDLALAEEESDYSALLDLSEEDIEQAAGDIESLDGDVTMVDSGSVDEELAEALAEEQMDEVPGEAVFTSAGMTSELSGAKLQKEQTRAQNKETLLEIINNANISETQKQEAVNSMISMTDVVNTEELTEAQRAQIEDIVIRKTGVNADAIIISTVNAD